MGSIIMGIRVLLVSFCFSSTFATVMAHVPQADFIKEQVDLLLLESKYNGISKINGRSIEDIRQELKEFPLTIVPSSRWAADGVGSYRAGGKWTQLGNEKSWTLSESHLQGMRDINRPYLSLHEVLGRDDVNFNKSSALRIYNEIHRSQERDPRLKRDPEALESLKRNIETKRGGGTTTGVDGGGDSRPLAYMSIIQNEMFFALRMKVINSSTYDAVSEWISSMQIDFNFKVPQGDLWYFEDRHVLLVPDKAKNEDSGYPNNLTKLRSFLSELYQKLAKP